MEQQIIQSIKKYIPELTDMALEERPDADRGSVEVTSAVLLLITSIYILNMAGRSPEIEQIINALVEELPRAMDDRKVKLIDAILEKDILEQASAHIYGAYNTNLLGAFPAIYNARVASDLQAMGSMTKGPMGELGGVAVVIGDALVGRDKTPNMLVLFKVISEHMTNITDIFRKGATKSESAGRESCFIATACYGTPYEANVVVLRKFREQVLKKYRPGKFLVKKYYQISPPIAKKVSSNKTLKRGVLLILNCIVFFIKPLVK